MAKLNILLALLLISGLAQARDNDRPQETPIYLAANAKPVEVREEQIERYRCERGQLIVAPYNSISSPRISTRRVMLQCVGH